MQLLQIKHKNLTILSSCILSLMHKHTHTHTHAHTHKQTHTHTPILSLKEGHPGWWVTSATFAAVRHSMDKQPPSASLPKQTLRSSWVTQDFPEFSFKSSNDFSAFQRVTFSTVVCVHGYACELSWIIPIHQWVRLNSEATVDETIGRPNTAPATKSPMCLSCRHLDVKSLAVASPLQWNWEPPYRPHLATIYHTHSHQH